MNENIYKRNLLIPFAKILCDIITVLLSVSFAYYLRFYSLLAQMIPPPQDYIPPFENYIHFALFVALIYFILFSVFRSYKTRLFSTFASEIGTIFKVNLIGILFAMSGAFLYRGFSYSRLVFLIILIISILFLLIERYLFHKLKNLLLEKGYNLLRTYLIGSNEQLTRIIPQIGQSGEHLFDISGYFSDLPVENDDYTYLGEPQILVDILQSNPCEAIIIAFNAREHHRIADIIKATEGKNIELFYVPDLLDLFISNYRTLEINKLFLMQLKRTNLSGWQGLIKYLFDIVVSAVSLFLLSPFLILIALIVKLSSPGPVFYKQKRVGLDGAQFEIIKFRSMRHDAEHKTGPVWANSNDPRVTGFGKFLRRTSLDELPQLFNVIRGDMSLVGPRPERPSFVQEFQSFIPKYRERHRVRSGITGWAQVNGLRGQSSIEERTRYDIYYIENWSLIFDIKILIMTILAIIKGENAY